MNDRLRCTMILMDLLKKEELYVDTVGTFIDKENINPMIKEAELHKIKLLDDFEIVKSPKVKSIILDHYRILSKNIKTLKFVMNNTTNIIPVFERLGN